MNDEFGICKLLVETYLAIKKRDSILLNNESLTLQCKLSYHSLRVIGKYLTNKHMILEFLHYCTPKQFIHMIRKLWEYEFFSSHIWTILSFIKLGEQRESNILSNGL